MPNKSVVIIGGGLAGLSAGIFACLNGYEAHILEHHAPGGVAASWRRGEYVIDGGIHFITGYKPGTAQYRLLEKLGLAEPGLYLGFGIYGRLIDETSGRSLLVTKDLDLLASDLISVSPADSAFVKAFIAGIEAFRGLDLSELGLSQPPELSGALGDLKTLWDMRPLWRFMIGRFARPMVDFVREIKTPFLRQCFLNLFSAEVPAWFALMILALLADGQTAFLAGGSRSFVAALVDRYTSLGGILTCGATVEKVLVENDRAVGVRLADGREYLADYVISAADGYSTTFDMLGGCYVNDRISTRYRDWPIAPPFLTVSYGIKRTFMNEPSFNTLILSKPVVIGQKEIRQLFVRILNYSDCFAPAGTTVVQVEIETEWDFWHSLYHNHKPAYDAEKNRLAAEFLSVLERLYPGLASEVALTDVATPVTNWRFTRNRQGTWGGWLMTAKLFNQKIERKLPGLSHFFMAGQWVASGGVSPALYSGRHAIQLLCHDDNRPFAGM